jgi:hypothetical protein
MKFRVFWDVAPCSHIELTDVSEVRTASVIGYDDGGRRTSKMSVNFNVSSRRYIQEDSKFNNKGVRKHEVNEKFFCKSQNKLLYSNFLFLLMVMFRGDAVMTYSYTCVTIF